jgi:hypothetical protein
LHHAVIVVDRHSALGLAEIENTLAPHQGAGVFFFRCKRATNKSPFNQRSK